MSCPKCGSNKVNYSCPLQCGGCGYEFPGTGLRVLTEDEARKKYPPIYGEAAPPLREPPSTVMEPADPICGTLMRSGPNRNGDMFDPAGLVVGFKGGDVVELPSTVAGPADPTCVALARARSPDMGAMLKGLEVGTVTPAPVPLPAPEDICTCCGQPNGDWKECCFCHGRICAACVHSTERPTSDYCQCRRCHEIGDDCEYLSVSITPDGRVTHSWDDKKGAKPGAIPVYMEHPGLVELIGAFEERINACLALEKR